MKAVVIRRYGGPEVVELAELPALSPAPGEVQIRVRASSVNPIDWKIRSGALRLFVRQPFPMVLGVDLAGEVSALGEGAQRFRVGDPVFAMAPHDLGANAELIALPESLVVAKPTALTMEQAASVPAVALTALQGLRDLGGLQPGQRVLINGASGGVGVYAVQLAKGLGAEVTAVASAANRELVLGLGADRFLDYRKTDFAGAPERYHLIFDCAGKRSFSEAKRALLAPGTFVSTEASPALFLRAALSSFSRRRAKALIVRSNGEDLDLVRELIDSGKVRPVVDRSFPLSDVRAAHAYSEAGHARGKIVLLH
jgi:NADPH:quinone reductase-like Zn-dependent oxidoreductase